MANEPVCPKGHGPMRLMGVAGHHDLEFSRTSPHKTRLIRRADVAGWECMECGERVDREAGASEKEIAVCDFCSSPDPVTTFECDDIHTLIAAVDDSGKILESQPWSSFGPWAACGPCAKFVEANDQEGLTAQAAEKLLARQTSPERRVAMTNALDQMHFHFFLHRRQP